MINKTFIGTFLGFLFGTIGGFVVGYHFSKNKYLDIAEKEIESVRKVYEKHFNTDTNKTETIQSDIKKPIPAPLIDPEKEKEDYQHYAGMYGETKEEHPKIGSVKSTIPQPKKQQKPAPVKTPYVITPDEYQMSEYESETLIWYSDKVLADTDGNVIHNINEVVGPEALSTFGRYLDDTVYVRDEARQIDYEILWDSRKFSNLNKLPGDGTTPEDSSEDY